MKQLLGCYNMLPSNGKKTQSQYDYFMTDEEAMAILRYCTDRKVSAHWKLAMNMLLFRGLRPSEVLAMNVRDFPGLAELDFSRVWVRIAKTNEEVELYLVKPLADMVRDYLLEPVGRSKYGAKARFSQLPSGYLFPKKSMWFTERPFMRSEDLGAFFSKVRKALWSRYPGFKERSPKGVYRIHPHTCRHWFQTRAALIEKDAYFLKELMHYKKLDTPLHYISSTALREKVPRFLEDNYGSVMRCAVGLKRGQLTMAEVS